LLTATDKLSTNFRPSVNLKPSSEIEDTPTSPSVTSMRLMIYNYSDPSCAQARHLVKHMIPNHSQYPTVHIESTIKRYTVETSSVVGIKSHVDDALYTTLVNLDSLEVKNEGATVFSEFGVKIQPIQGQGIIFRNYTVPRPINWSSRHDLNLLHSGERISGPKKTTKTIMQFLSSCSRPGYY
jgi:hypothetical protein